MTTEIILAVIALAAAPLGAWLNTLFLRRKYDAEIQGIRADVDKTLTEVKSQELNNVREGNDILMEQIVKPLKIEIKHLRNDVKNFRLAIEKIPSCPYSADCPVSTELFTVEKGAAANLAPNREKRTDGAGFAQRAEQADSRGAHELPYRKRAADRGSGDGDDRDFRHGGLPGQYHGGPSPALPYNIDNPENHPDTTDAERCPASSKQYGYG